MTAPDYFEQVARVMKNSITVGPLCTYEEILQRLHARFRTEAELRAYVERWEDDLQGIEPGFRLFENASGQ